jgi:hypothetical protein
MKLSIREASRFVIGAAMMRAKAIEASGNAGITLDDVALAALREGADGEKLRLAIETLADQESGWMRNTPPHVLKTERVLQSREAEVHAFTAISAAVVATVELADDASAGNAQAYQTLHGKYMDAFRSIDKTPGSTQDKRQLKSLLRDQALAMTTEGDFIGTVLKSAETAYLEADADAILSRYDTLDRSDDFDM